MKGDQFKTICVNGFMLFFLFLSAGLSQANEPTSQLIQNHSTDTLPSLSDTTSLDSAILWLGPHQLQAGEIVFNKKAKVDQSNNQVTIWIFLILVIIAITRFLFPNRFKEILLASWDYRFYNQIEREGGLLNTWVSFALYLNFLFTLSFLFYQSASHLGITDSLATNNSILLLLYSLILPAVFFFLKFVLAYFSAWVFNTISPTESGFRITLIVNQLTGVVLLPLLILSFYTSSGWMLYLAWVIIILLATYRLFRLSAIGLRISGFSTYHLILYLCTIEIAPYVFLIKYINTLIYI